MACLKTGETMMLHHTVRGLKFLATNIVQRVPNQCSFPSMHRQGQQAVLCTSGRLFDDSLKSALLNEIILSVQETCIGR